MSGWIIKRGTREVPIPDEATLHKWADEGRFNPSDLIFHPTLQRWLYANEVLEIKSAFERRQQAALQGTTSTPTESLAATQSVHQPSPSDFLISQDGQQFRAPDAPTLRRWADEGRVRANSNVFDPTSQRWICARDVPALQSAYQNPLPEQILKLATSYRQLILWLAAQIIIYLCLTAVNSVRSLAVLSLVFLVALCVSVVALAVYAYRTAEALGSSVAPLWAIAMIIPCVNIITLLALSSKATAACQAHGIRVGFLGPQV